MNGFNGTVAVCSEKGVFRSNNEDNFYCQGIYKPLTNADQPYCNGDIYTGLCLCAVFDGMGGESYGEIAAYIAAEELHERAEKILTDAQVTQYVHETNRKICLESERRCVSMGTTLVMAIVIRRYLHIYNLGDSRAYLLRNYTLSRLSSDHTAVRGKFNNTPGKQDHYLTQHLGVPEDEFVLEPHYTGLELCGGDRLLLCSDGVTDVLGEETIKQILMRYASPQTTVKDFVETAVNNGGRDDITALALFCQ